MFISGWHHQIMAGSLMRLECQNFEVWPIFLILNVFSALEGTLQDLFVYLYIARITINNDPSWDDQ